jgi:hypothetical protein
LRRAPPEEVTMSWKDNRRRKRTWYRHYKWLCDRVKELIGPYGRGESIAAEAFVRIMFELYESRRMHRRRRIATSAFESLKLACEDTGLTKIGLVPQQWVAQPRPQSKGEFEKPTPQVPSVPSPNIDPPVYYDKPEKKDALAF